MSGYIGTQPVPQATQTRDSFTATANQTSFATSGYTPEFLDVFLNGVKLAASDYTATNGSDVVLASGAAASDILEVVAYSTFEVLNPTFDGNVTFTGNASFGDNDKAIFGDGNDLQIYHDGSNSYIEDAGTGNLTIKSNTLVIADTDGDNMLVGLENGEARLYNNGSQKLATTSTGVDVTGTVTADGLTVGSSSISAGTGLFQQIQTAGNNMYVGIGSNNSAYVQANGEFRIATGGYADKVTVTTSGNVGIGTSSPSGSGLHIKKDTSATTNELLRLSNCAGSATDGVKLVMEVANTSGNGAEIGTVRDGGSFNPYMYFSTSAGIGSNPVERMRIDSSGNVLVGKTTGAFATAGTKITSTGNVEITAASDGALALGRTGSDGYIQRFYKDSALVGSIGVSASNNLAVGSTSGSHSGITFGTNTVAPMNVSNFTNADDTYDLGNTSARWQDLYLSGGIYLGGTGSANKLDDYEEGTWTPTAVFSGGGSPIYVRQLATYTKIGRFVFCDIAIIFQKNNGSGSLSIRGFPFSNTSGNDRGGSSFGYFSGINGIPIGLMDSGTANCDIRTALYSTFSDNNNGSASITHAQLDAETNFHFSITYKTNA